MPSTRKSPSPGALETLSNWRSRLEIENTPFRAASQIGRRADAFLKAIKDRLKARRKELGWDQLRLANALEYSQSAISKLESGATDISLRTLFRMSHTLGLHPVITFVPAAQGVEPESSSAGPAPYAHESAIMIEEAQEKMLHQVSSALSEAMSDIAQASLQAESKMLEVS